MIYTGAIASLIYNWTSLIHSPGAAHPVRQVSLWPDHSLFWEISTGRTRACNAHYACVAQLAGCVLTASVTRFQALPASDLIRVLIVRGSSVVSTHTKRSIVISTNQFFSVISVHSKVAQNAPEFTSELKSNHFWGSTRPESINLWPDQLPPPLRATLFQWLWGYGEGLILEYSTHK